MSLATHAQGSLFQVETAAAGVYVTIAELTSISFNSTSDELDTTSHDSQNRSREYIQGLKSFEFSMEGNLVPNSTTHNTNATTGLLGLYRAGTVKNFRLVYNVSPTVMATFLGFVRELNVTAPVDEKLAFTCTVRGTNDITWS